MTGVVTWIGLEVTVDCPSLTAWKKEPGLGVLGPVEGVTMGALP